MTETDDNDDQLDGIPTLESMLLDPEKLDEGVDVQVSPGQNWPWRVLSRHSKRYKKLFEEHLAPYATLLSTPTHERSQPQKDQIARLDVEVIALAVPSWGKILVNGEVYEHSFERVVKVLSDERCDPMLKRVVRAHESESLYTGVELGKFENG